MPINWEADPPPLLPLLPVEVLRDMAGCLAWMQHLRERSEGLMEQYESLRLELERLAASPPIQHD